MSVRPPKRWAVPPRRGRRGPPSDGRGRELGFRQYNGTADVRHAIPADGDPPAGLGDPGATVVVERQSAIGRRCRWYQPDVLRPRASRRTFVLDAKADLYGQNVAVDFVDASGRWAFRLNRRPGQSDCRRRGPLSRAILARDAQGVARCRTSRVGSSNAIAGILATIGGLVVVVTSVVPWADLSEIGLDPIRPSGIGVAYLHRSVYLGLGWVTLLLGIVIAGCGVAAVIGKGLVLPSLSTAAGAAAAVVLISGSGVLVADASPRSMRRSWGSRCRSDNGQPDTVDHPHAGVRVARRDHRTGGRGQAEDDARVLWRWPRSAWVPYSASGWSAWPGGGSGRALQPADDGGFGLRPAALVDWPVGAAAVRGGAPPVDGAFWIRPWSRWRDLGTRY